MISTLVAIEVDTNCEPIFAHYQIVRVDRTLHITMCEICNASSYPFTFLQFWDIQIYCVFYLCVPFQIGPRCWVKPH